METREQGRSVSILHVIDRLEHFGGTPTKLANSARRMKPEIRTSFFCTDALGGLGAELQAEGVPVTVAKAEGFGPTLVGELVRTISELRPDVMVSHFYKATIAARFASLIVGTPLFTYHHGNIRKAFPYRLLDRATLRLTHRHLVNSSYTRRLIASRYGLEEASVDVLYPFVPEFAVTPRRRSRGGRVVGNVAGLNHYKGQDTLLRAFATVVMNEPDARLLIAGEGPLRASLEALAEEILPADTVKFCGSVSDIPKFLSELDVFVFPSVDEGFGIAVVEAMLAELPIVVTAAGALPEIIRDGQNGLMVPVRDPAALAAAILSLMNDTELASRLARSARRDAYSQFSSGSLVAEKNYWREVTRATQG